jgi:hypothetical protein
VIGPIVKALATRGKDFPAATQLDELAAVRVNS